MSSVAEIKTTATIGRTTVETIHGNPGERRTLPVGLLVELTAATNLPPDAQIIYWARPLPLHPWPVKTAQWATDVGVGLRESDVEIIPQQPRKAVSA